MRRRVRPLLSGCVVVLGLSAGAAEDPVVATVDGVPVPRSALERAWRELPERYRRLPKEALLRPLLERVIDDELLRREAERLGLDRDPAVAAEIEHARTRVLRNALLERIVAAATTEEALRARYAERVRDPAARVVELRVRHILLPDEATARAVIRELDAGADFAELARRRSTGPSGPRGGDLGWVRREELVPEFGAAAFALAPGTHGREPVRTRFGWHVIRVEDRRELVPDFAELEEELRQELAREAVEARLERLRAAARIEIHEKALAGPREEGTR